MSYLLAALAIVIAGWSLTWSTSAVTHITVILLCLPLLWWTDVTTRPLVPCRYCDKGRTWDNAGEHFGEVCGGGLLGLGSCGATGKKLRWEARLLRALGAGHQLRNLPDAMRGDDAS